MCLVYRFPKTYKLDHYLCTLLRNGRHTCINPKSWSAYNLAFYGFMENTEGKMSPAMPEIFRKIWSRERVALSVLGDLAKGPTDYHGYSRGTPKIALLTCNFERVLLDPALYSELVMYRGSKNTQQFTTSRWLDLIITNSARLGDLTDRAAYLLNIKLLPSTAPGLTSTTTSRTLHDQTFVVLCLRQWHHLVKLEIAKMYANPLQTASNGQGHRVIFYTPGAGCAVPHLKPLSFFISIQATLPFPKKSKQGHLECVAVFAF
ncbi:uncharacterized protein EDB93DRAFT_1103101 [Suillus bovinus]|uniref:uncharacterized protein n=1 Tax=Suillus bovinus TaxID=48563 RepID=UPI001B86A92E|nr:uncharacterized protein EDB93DRAFT_1103101 [Suillus bovinus]KAG2151670.1 hypothetical protein EDB93DRAFT_1103101 [Suillus bovinus]